MEPGKDLPPFFLVHMHLDLVGNRNVAVHHVARERVALCHGFAAFEAVESIVVAVLMRGSVR